MSSQRFSVQVREAIWQAHGCKCLYCTKSLLFADLVIDHVIPEATTWEEVQKIVARIGLPKEFSIYNWGNHAPSCHSCNKEKLDRPLYDGTLAITLRRVEEKLPKVQELVLKAKAAWDLDKTIRTIAHALEAGKYTHDDLAKHLEMLRRFPHGIRGSGGPSPPASPETRALGVEFSGPQFEIRISEAAKAVLDELDLSYGDLARRIELSVAERSFDIKLLKPDGAGEPQSFIMRLGPTMRMIYDMSPDAIDIREIVHRGG